MMHHFRSPSGAVASIEAPRWHQARREAARELRCSEQDCEPVDRKVAAWAWLRSRGEPETTVLASDVAVSDTPAAAPGPPQDAPAAEAGRVGLAKRAEGNVGAKV